MDATTVNHIKGLQYVLGLPGSGVIDERTAQGIQALRDRHQINT